MALITNLIPVLLLFAISYLLFRRIQHIRSNHENNELASKIENEIRKDFIALGDDVKVLSDTLKGGRVQIVPYEQRYKERMRRIQEAEFEFLLLSNYAFDWDLKKSRYPSERTQSPERKAYFDTIQNKLQFMKGRRFHYVRIVQIPEDHNLKEILAYDDQLRELSTFLIAVSNREPEFASLRTSAIISPYTFLIVDRSCLILDVEVHNLDTGLVDTPCVILIDDPTSQAIQDLLKIFQRIEARSTLVTHIS